MEAIGDPSPIQFGQVRGAAVEWTDLPHARFDGVGGIAHLLRARGLKVSPLPTATRLERPGFWSRVWGVLRHDPSGDKKPRVAWKSFDPGRRQQGPKPPPAAWRLLTKEQTDRLAARAEAEGASTNSVLLAALDGVVAPRLTANEAPSLWMVPVNMRGPVTRPRDTQNQSSYLPVSVPRGASPAVVHAEVKRLLADRVHWSVWFQVESGRWVGRKFYEKAIRSYYARPGHPWLGAFTNLGAWPLEGDESPPGVDDVDGWLVAAPVFKTIPLASGVMTWKGRLGLTLRAHPALTEDQTQVEGWLTAWVDSLKV